MHLNVQFFLSKKRGRQISRRGVASPAVTSNSRLFFVSLFFESSSYPPFTVTDAMV